MRFFWNNLIDASGVVFTPSSEVSTLPGSNVAHEFRTKVWRTGTSTAAESIIFDLGSAASATAIIVLDHTLTAGDSAIALEANSASAWGSPPFSQSLTYAAGTIHQAFGSQSYRYWRLKFTKSAAGQSRDFGRIFLGTYLEPTDLPDYNGYDEKLQDLSRKSKSRSGQTWTDRQSQFGELSLSLSRFSQTDVDNLKSMFDSVGQSRSLFFQCSTSGALNKVWYVKFKKAYGRKVMAYDGGYLWDADLEMEEQI